MADMHLLDSQGYRSGGVDLDMEMAAQVDASGLLQMTMMTRRKVAALIVDLDLLVPFAPNSIHLPS